MELTAVPATQFSSVQLTDILNACFEAYLVPVTQSVEGFVQRFSAEGMSLVDSRVWLAGDEPAAIAIVARRGSAARLAAFALRPAWRGKGLGRKLMQELLMLLQQQGIETVFLEVIRDNHCGRRAVSVAGLYATLWALRLPEYRTSGPGAGRITALSHPVPASARH